MTYDDDARATSAYIKCLYEGNKSCFPSLLGEQGCQTYYQYLHTLPLDDSRFDCPEPQPRKPKPRPTKKPRRKSMLHGNEEERILLNQYKWAYYDPSIEMFSYNSAVVNH